jgi:hypothetical protein
MGDPEKWKPVFRKISLSHDRHQRLGRTSMRNEKIDAILAAAKPRVAAHWASCLKWEPERDDRVAAHSAVDKFLQRYFEQLKALPDPAEKSAILDVLQTLFANLDDTMSEFGGSLLETDERELLCGPIIDAAEAAGLVLSQFEYGDPTLQYRNF